LHRCWLYVMAKPVVAAVRVPDTCDTLKGGDCVTAVATVAVSMVAKTFPQYTSVAAMAVALPRMLTAETVQEDVAAAAGDGIMPTTNMEDWYSMVQRSKFRLMQMLFSWPCSSATAPVGLP